MFLLTESVRVLLRLDRHGPRPLSLPFACRLPTAAQPPQSLARASAAMSQGGPELEHIVGGTDQRPFPAHRPHPPQQELSIAAALRDLAEHRLDDRFPPGLESSTTRRAARAAHPVSPRQTRGQSPSGAAGTTWPCSWRSGGMRGRQPSAVRAMTGASLK